MPALESETRTAQAGEAGLSGNPPLQEKLQCEKHVFEGMGHGMIPHHEDLVPILKKQWSVSSQEQTDKSL
jgi:hypothetical protein